MEIKRFIVTVCGDSEEMKDLDCGDISSIVKENITVSEFTGLSNAVVEVSEYDPLFIVGERP